MIKNKKMDIGFNFSCMGYTFPIQSIKQILSSKPKQAIVNGWIRSIRHQKQVVFLDISDGTCHEGLQAVISPELAQG